MCVREKQKGCSLTFSNRKKEFTSSSSPLPIHPSSPMSPMAKSRPPKRILESYTIKGSDRVIKPGDSVLMKAFDSSKPPYVARVEAIEAAGSRGTNVRGRVRWYYRPEESIGGRRPFHGAKEVFLSDHYDVQSADTIEGKCNVYSFRDYTKLDAVNAEDYFCRFEYKSATGSFVPDHIAVFCKCEMPYNPDDLMIQCEECSDWFHPSCLGMSIKVAKKLEHFFCESCGAENGKKIENSHEVTRQSEEKARKIGMLHPAATRIRRPRAASAEDKVTSAARVKRGHGEGGGSGGGNVRRRLLQQLVESKRRRR